MIQRARRIAAAAAALFLVAVTSAAAQNASPGARIDQAVHLLVEQGQWPQACQELEQVLQDQGLTLPEKTRARKYLALGRILMGQDSLAVEVFKALVRDDSRFAVEDLSLEGSEPPVAAIRFFGQAVVQVLHDERKAREAQLLKTSRSGAFLRSAVLPGWGQRYQGYRKRGNLFVAVAVSVVGDAVRAEIGYRDARHAYDHAPQGADFEALHSQYRSKANRADVALWTIGGLWLANALDAASQRPNISRSPVSLRPTAEGQGVQMVYLKEF